MALPVGFLTYSLPLLLSDTIIAAISPAVGLSAEIHKNILVVFLVITENIRLAAGSFLFAQRPELFWVRF